MGSHVYAARCCCVVPVHVIDSLGGWARQDQREAASLGEEVGFDLDAVSELGGVDDVW